jgi:hypothetical protein
MRVKEAEFPESLRNAWSTLVPPVWEKGGRGVDVRVQWNGNDDSDNDADNIPSGTTCGCVLASADNPLATTTAARAATTLLHELQHQLPSSTQLLSDTDKHKMHMEQSLTASMQLFQDFCQEHVKDACQFQVRITSSRGTTGTKCPVWHMDHVPVRWIQSLVGPGCMWVQDQEQGHDATGTGTSIATSVEQWNNKVYRADQAQVDNDNYDNDDNDDEWMAQSAKERNQQLIGPTATVRQAAPGEAVMLIGKRWSELSLVASQSAQAQSCSDGSDSDSSTSVNIHIPAAIHKSPDQLLPWQGRVLLTMDVLYDRD